MCSASDLWFQCVVHSLSLNTNKFERGEMAGQTNMGLKG